MQNLAAHAIGYRSLEQESQFENLTVDGSVPNWLRGSLLRLGPGKFETGKIQLAHHFDGFGVLHRFGFTENGVSYRNAFLKTPMLRDARATGDLSHSTYGTASSRPAAPDAPWNVNANVNIAPLAGLDLAWTDGASVPIQFDPDDLSQDGILAWDDALASTNCAGKPRALRTGNMIPSLATPITTSLITRRAQAIICSLSGRVNASAPRLPISQPTPPLICTHLA
jgi:beta,beta-carotene 9',10'-dioxygenase